MTYPANTIESHLETLPLELTGGQILVKRQYDKKREHLFLKGVTFLFVETFLHQLALLPVDCELLEV